MLLHFFLPSSFFNPESFINTFLICRQYDIDFELSCPLLVHVRSIEKFAQNGISVKTKSWGVQAILLNASIDFKMIFIDKRKKVLTMDIDSIFFSLIK